MTIKLQNLPTLPTDPRLRWTAMLAIENILSNLNGDPDNSGEPRIIDGFAVATDASIKRIVRDHAERLGAKLYVARGTDRGLTQDAYPDEVAGAKVDSVKSMLADFFDLRLFGGVLTRKGARPRGPIQIGMARTFSPAVPESIGITCVSGGEEGTKGNMGRHSLLPHALFLVPIFFNPFDAAKVGTTPADLEMFWTALIGGFQFHRSARRSQVHPVGLTVFVDESDAQRNVEPAHMSLSRFKIKRLKNDSSAGLSDYQFSVDRSNLPERMSIVEQWWIPGREEELAQAAK